MITEEKLLDLVKRLRKYKASVPRTQFQSERRVHPKICEEAADMLIQLKYHIADPYDEGPP